MYLFLMQTLSHYLHNLQHSSLDFTAYHVFLCAQRPSWALLTQLKDLYHVYNSNLLISIKAAAHNVVH